MQRRGFGSGWGWDRARALVRRPVAACLILLVLYGGLSLLNDPGGHLGADTGAKVHTLEVNDRTDDLTLDIGYWAEAHDPSGRLHPLHQTRRQSDGSWVAVTTLPMLVAGVPLYEWGGYRATLLLPMLGAVFAALGARSLSRRIDPDTDGWAAFWMVGLASPVVIYALDFWEHSIGVACIIGAVSVLLGIVDGRPVWTAVGAGLLLGTGAVMRNEVLVYALVSVGATCLVLLGRRRFVAAVATGVATLVGFAGPWFANAWLESAVEGQSRADRAVGTASRVDPTGPESLRLGERVEEGLQTLFGLVSGDPVTSALLGGGVVLAVLVAMRAERRSDTTFAVVALVAAGLVYAADALGDLGFVPGMLVAFPLAIAGLRVQGRSSAARRAVVIAVVALPIVYLFQFLGGAGPQWGGRYTLGSAIILGVVGLSGLRTSHPVVGRGLLVLTVAVTVLGVAFLGQRSRGVVGLFDDVDAASADVLIARQAFVLREAGAAGVGKRWFSVENEAEFTAAVDITREIGEERFTVLEWDGAAPPESVLPDDVIEVDRTMTDFVGTPVGLVTYEFADV